MFRMRSRHNLVIAGLESKSLTSGRHPTSLYSQYMYMLVQINNFLVDAQILFYMGHKTLSRDPFGCCAFPENTS